MAALNLVTSPQEYFHTQVTQATSELKLSIEPEVEYYLVNLLCDFINPGKILELTGVDVISTPLALQLKNAVESSGMQKQTLFRRIGDTSLYISGFFQDYFNRKTFDIKYYMDLGSSAYSQVYEILRLRASEQHTSVTYQNLSENFIALVDILAVVASHSSQVSSKDLLSIYDRWTKTNSQHLRKVLEQQGIMPVPTPTRSQN